MAILLFLLSIVLFIISIVLLIIRFIKKQPKKPILFLLLSSILIFFGSLLLPETENSSKTDETEIKDEIAETADGLSDYSSPIPKTTPSPTNTPELRTPEPTVLYAEDDVVNWFITKFNDNSVYEITDIRKGHIRIKYFGYANDCYLELNNYTDTKTSIGCFEITINGGRDTDNLQKMYDVFSEVLRIMDPSISEDNVNTIINGLKKDNTMKEGQRISDNIIITFVPCVELSYGFSNARIDVSIYNIDINQ